MFWSFSNKNVTPPTVIPNTYICAYKVHVFPKYLQNVAKQRQVTLVTGKELLAEVTSLKNVTSCILIRSSGSIRLCSNYGTEFPMCRTSIEFATDKVTIGGAVPFINLGIQKRK